jgi:hypothetical protein
MNHKLVTCNICNKYLHDINYVFCGKCRENVDDCDYRCYYCYENDDIYISCTLCEDGIYIDDINDEICFIFLEKIILLQRWFNKQKYNKNNKYNKVLWKISEYYMKKKYHPKNILNHIKFD